MHSFVVLFVFALFSVSSPLTAQNILDMAFEAVPPGAELVASPIGLDGKVQASGEVESEAGFRFPDGTLQTSAASPATITESVTANSGLYSNKIADMVPPEGYIEVCFKGGVVLSDFHGMSESTAGGNCLPGDTGWIIERDERSASLWQNAKADCLASGMRLPEAFEWFYTCEQASSFGVNDMAGNWEWASNQALPISGSVGYVGVAIQGEAACSSATVGAVGSSNEFRASYVYRCAR